MLSKQELTMGRDKQFPEEFTREVSKNLDVLTEKMNSIRTAYGKPMIVSSGWRPKAINDITSNAAKKSKHTVGLAVDILDRDSKLWAWCIKNLDLISSLGLYLEDKRWTPNWVHFGIGSPASKKRIFIPSSAKPLAPDLWDGKYDKKYDNLGE